MERPISIGDHCERKSGFIESAWTRDTRDANSNLGTSNRQQVGRGKTNRESRNKNAMKQYESAEEKRINEEKRKFNGMRRTEADKKLRSILFLALGSEGKRVSTQKNPRVKILAISFSEFWTLLDAAFNKPPNTTFESYKLLNRKQNNRESYE